MPQQLQPFLQAIMHLEAAWEGVEESLGDVTVILFVISLSTKIAALTNLTIAQLQQEPRNTLLLFVTSSIQKSHFHSKI